MYIYTYIYTYMYIYIYIDIYINIYIYRVTKTRGAVGGGGPFKYIIHVLQYDFIYLSF